MEGKHLEKVGFEGCFFKVLGDILEDLLHFKQNIKALVQIVDSVGSGKLPSPGSQTGTFHHILGMQQLGRNSSLTQESGLH